MDVGGSAGGRLAVGQPFGKVAGVRAERKRESLGLGVKVARHPCPMSVSGSEARLEAAAYSLPGLLITMRRRPPPSSAASPRVLSHHRANAYPVGGAGGRCAGSRCRT